ncbi:MAG: hypothetical protein WC770_01155 [Phycisphaerae bacterium]|jgi:hypothetical protein
MAVQKGIKIRRRHKKPANENSIQIVSPEIIAQREKYFGILTIVVLFAFGVYHSILYFGHTAVPNSDFPAFFSTGRQLLSFHIPSSFKRVPVLGILQVLLSWIIGGQHPGLTAGWLLNAILHPFNLILLWLICRKFVGKSGLWIAIIAILNPMVIYLLTEPIVETTFLFFILLTFYFILKNSRWSYLFASIATMTRYEGAALILAAFIIDMINSKTKQERFRIFLYSALAATPVAIWMVGILMTPHAESYLTVYGKEYAKLYAQPEESRTGFFMNLGVLWETGFQPLLIPFFSDNSEDINMVWGLSKFFAIMGFAFGSIYGLFKRRWEVLALLIFLISYFAIHLKFPVQYSRYYMPISWVALLLCWFGLQNIWNLLNKNRRIPKPIIFLLQAIILTITIIWLISLPLSLPKLTPASAVSVSMPYVAIVVVLLLLAGRTYIYKIKNIFSQVVILAVLGLIIASNQFILAPTLGNGQRDIEFKLLGNWYVANAKPGEKMGLFLSHVVQIYAPKYADNLVYLPTSDNPVNFVKACYDANITYVVWASREGLSRDASYHQTNLDKNIAMLREPKSIGPYEYITTIKANQYRYVNIFRLKPRP